VPNTFIMKMPKGWNPDKLSNQTSKSFEIKDGKITIVLQTNQTITLQQ